MQCLLEGPSKSHQRSWWMFHTQPTKGRLRPVSRNSTNAVGGLFILSLQRSDSAPGFPNPTNAVGGSFILSLQRSDWLCLPETCRGSRCRPSMNNSPTALVGFGTKPVAGRDVGRV